MQSLLNHPHLMDCRRLFLRDYEVWINIGVHDFEKKEMCIRDRCAAPPFSSTTASPKPSTTIPSAPAAR